MRLKKLLKGITTKKIVGKARIDVRGITSHSKIVAPGDLFVARKGSSMHGSRFANEAALSGAVAIVSDIHDPFLQNVTQIVVEDPGKIEAQLAANFYGDPSKELCLIGITGTNGKTTCSYLIRHLLKSVGVVGSIEWIIGEKRLPSRLTTPDVHTCAKLARDMCEAKCKYGVYEVSSHALDQGRVDALDFDIALFTNLTQDHLDYHKTFDNYLHAKQKLFTSLGKKRKGDSCIAIVNGDDPYAHELLKECNAPVLTYGVDTDADLRAKDLETTLEGVSFSVNIAGYPVQFRSPLIGRFNVYNSLAVIAVGLHCKAPIDQIIEALRTFTGVPGRLERIQNRAKLNVFVDFAHTPDALENTLSSLRPLCSGKLIVVFGCGGDRDREKRSKMGAACERYADLSIVTSDNPRSEKPRAIIDDVLKGFSVSARVVVEEERKRAIESAIEMATPRDIVLIAGKGHEKTQLVAGKSIPFDDCKIALQACDYSAAPGIH